MVMYISSANSRQRISPWAFGVIWGTELGWGGGPGLGGGGGEGEVRSWVCCGGRGQA